MSLIAIAPCIAVAENAVPDQPSREYQIKAAFCHKFLFFTDWPEQAFAHEGGDIIIGIVGKDPFGDAFQAVEDSSINDRPLTIRRLGADPKIDDLRSCHLLFISSSVGKELGAILEQLEQSPVLTVSDLKGFADAGGMVGFVTREGRLRMEINRTAAGRVGLDFRAKVLRLADRVIEDES